jgi:hypothetical protein
MGSIIDTTLPNTGRFQGLAKGNRHDVTETSNGADLAVGATRVWAKDPASSCPLD